MNARAMQLSFEMKIGQFSNYDFPMPLQSHEVQDYLNEAQGDETLDLYERFEKTERERTVLGPLIKNQPFSSFSTGAADAHPNGHIVNLPNEVWFPLEERCTVGYTDYNGDAQTKQVRVLPLTHDEYTLNVNNPYQKPFDNLVWRMDLGATGSAYKRHELISDGIFLIDSYNLRYLKRPVDIDIQSGNTSELDPAVHDRIVDRAVQIALQARGIAATQVANQNQES